MDHAVHAAVHQAHIGDADALVLLLRGDEQLIEHAAVLLHVLNGIAVNQRRLLASSAR